MTQISLPNRVNYSERINEISKTIPPSFGHPKILATEIQTRILKELHELQQKEKRNLKNYEKSRMEILKRVDWTDTLLTETENQDVEGILLEYPDIFARHRMDICMNTEFKVKLTQKDDKAA